MEVEVEVEIEGWAGMGMARMRKEVEGGALGPRDISTEMAHGLWPGLEHWVRLVLSPSPGVTCRWLGNTEENISQGQDRGCRDGGCDQRRMQRAARAGKRAGPGP